jgi:hypothetical protein
LRHDEWKNPERFQEEYWNELLDAVFATGTSAQTLSCPNCSERKVHYFFMRARFFDPQFLNAGERGGAWIWCSECRLFCHYSGLVPAWWIDVAVPAEQLTDYPGWLDSNLEKWESTNS